ncbi:hypothetical protein HRbin01_00320 [archaeon HR01]|nr:hypothetical protein HRbin01_00320 [archaeon HR01]
MIAPILLLAATLVLPFQAGGGAKTWLVGFGGELMLPYLDGGVLEARTGWALSVRVLGGNGSLTVDPPDGPLRQLQIIDGGVESFILDSPGDWGLTTDEGYRLTVRVQPVLKPAITVLTTPLSNGTVEVVLRQPPRGYAFFEGAGGEQIHHPGDEVEISLESNSTGPYMVNLLEPQQAITYTGLLQGTPYTLTMPRLVASQLLYPDQRRLLVFRLPGEGETGPGGLVPLGLGRYTVQISAFTGSGYEPLQETEVTVVSRELDVSRLSSRARFDAVEGMSVFKVLVGDEEGGVTEVFLHPPLAWIKVVDSVHNETVANVGVQLSNTLYRGLGAEVLVVYESVTSFTEYSAGMSLKPVRNASFPLTVNGFPTKPLNIYFTPGTRYIIPVQLYKLSTTFHRPDNRPYPGPVTVEIGTVRKTMNTGEYVVLPPGEYTVKAVNPPSFTPATVNLDADKEATIVVLENPAQLSAMRAAAVALSIAITYQLYKMALKKRK